MEYSRRNFMKAAGAGAITTTVGAVAVGVQATTAAAPPAPSPLAISNPMTKEAGSFIINGKSYPAEYEARTTLWEVIAVKLGMTGTNRSCNRASCGACSVLMDGTPFYSCHTLAMEAVGKKILTVEGLGDEKNLHPLQRIGYMYMAADCGFCTPGWEVTAKGLLDKNRNPTADQVKAALAGHICRCAAYSEIIRTVVDTGKVLRGELEIAKIDPQPEAVIQVNLPMVRDYSTAGGHTASDTLVEGDEKIVTKKWQGYPPQNLNVVGKSLPPIAAVALPRYTGKAGYASRVVLPNMLHVKMLTTPYPRARIKDIDTSKAEKMPGVAYVLTYKNAPKAYPLPQELEYQGEIVAMVAADTEDLAEEAVQVINVDYEVLPFAATLDQTMAPNAPDLRNGKGNLMLQRPNSPEYDSKATALMQFGDLDKGFAEADIIKEFSYHFSGAVPVPIQPGGGVAKWDGDKLTFWGMGQAIHPLRDAIAKGLGIETSKVRYINQYNGCTFGGGQMISRLNPWIAYIAKMAGRPARLMMPKDQELGQLQVKPETITKFKVGAKKNGQIVALLHEAYFGAGNTEGAGMAGLGGTRSHLMLYGSTIPNWKSIGYNYRTSTMKTGASRSNQQQERKWSWEIMMDDMAEAVGMDPVQFRMMHMSRPGTKLARGWAGLASPYESVNGQFFYSDSFASVEVLQEGSKVIGWDKRNPQPGGNPGRFKRGIGVAMSQHHAGNLGYREGEAGFAKIEARTRGGGAADFGGQYGAGGGDAGFAGGGLGTFHAQVEVNADGTVTVENAQPDSGTNHDTTMATLVAEMLGFTTRDHVHVMWGDSDLVPQSPGWHSGHTTTLQGGALCSAADKLRQDLFKRAADVLKADAGKLQIRDGVISSTEDAKKRITFAELVKANKGPIRITGSCVSGRSVVVGIGACFLEVEVDTWTGNWRYIRTAYCTDVGNIINPLMAEADMHGSFVESAALGTEALPWDREFPGTKHYSVGYLSYRLPTIMDVPELQTNVFVNSLEPRWFFGVKGMAETAIGGVPSAISNAIYNACGVRIREHPITRDKVMAGLAAKGVTV